MKLVVWNCNMAFRRKADRVLQFSPDIAIIPECEHPGKLGTGFDQKPDSVIWHGSNTNKGLAVISFNDYKIKLLDDHNENIKTILPILISKKRRKYLLLAVWAYNPLDRGYNYIGQLWKAIEMYQHLFQNRKVIIAGDFNSNTIWDSLKRKVSHTMVVEKLAGFGIVSAYHTQTKQHHGKEQHPTFFLYRHENKPYHLDYCFVSRALATNIKSVEIGTHADWTKYSDHSPLIVEFQHC